jgi:GNAT superfamily N-acetyltransferase
MTVSAIPPERAEQVTETLVSAFRGYPVMRFVLGVGSADDDRRLRRLVGFFVAARALRGEWLLGIGGSASLDAAALVSNPLHRESPPALASLRDALWEDLGSDARTRYEACGAAWQAFATDVPHLHLNMIGVDPRARGRGLGRLLLDHVAAMAREIPGSLGVSLTTEDPANVPLYQHLGYAITGHVHIAPGLESWGMFRRTAPAG